MSYDPISYLGLSCPSGGDFYLTPDIPGGFIGCCDVDPSDNGVGICFSESLHPAAFNPDRYDNLTAQDCISSTSKWYTCKNGPTFIGCCTLNPCDNQGVCPENNLDNARLSSDQSSIKPFLSSTATTFEISTKSTSTSFTHTPNYSSTSAIVSATSTSSPGAIPNNKGDSHASIGAIVGGVVGGFVVLGIVAFAYYRYRRRRRTLATRPSDEDAMTALQSPWSPYHDSFRNSSIVPPGSVSPLSPASTHHRSLSESLSSLIGFKRGSAAQRRSAQLCTNCETIVENRTHAHPVELEGQPPRAVSTWNPAPEISYEVLGSIPDIKARDTTG
ncbi:hypothetical protein F5Y10DRAFT_62859 [Nemania abortiva]|nr:hypothetical protein F5Y10DRAFT_62859 [Nemania abortiva]